MGKEVAILAILVVSISSMFAASLFPNAVKEDTMTVPLQAAEQKNAYTVELVHVPIFIKDVRVDASVKFNTYLWLWCELRVGNVLFNFTLNDLSVGFRFEQGRFQVDGKASEQMLSFRTIINTDGVIEDVPKLILTFYSLT